MSEHTHVSQNRSRLDAVRRRPLYEQAVDALRDAILSGVFHPGERLHESVLAAELNLSRGPVREALRKLEQEGIVVSKPNLGASVVSLEGDELYDALELREFLETLRCEQTIARLTTNDLQELEKMVDEMAAATKSGDLVRATEADFAFHERLVTVSGADLILRTWRSIAGQLRMTLALSNPVRLREVGDIAGDHRPILHALEAKDAEQLRRHLRPHIRSVKPLLNTLAEGVPLAVESRQRSATNRAPRS